MIYLLDIWLRRRKLSASRKRGPHCRVAPVDGRAFRGRVAEIRAARVGV